MSGVEALDANGFDRVPEHRPSLAAWDDSAGEYDGREGRTSLQAISDCLGMRESNGSFRIDKIDAVQLEAATQSIELAETRTGVIDIAPQVDGNLGVRTEARSALEDRPLKVMLLGRQPPFREARDGD